MPKGEIMNPNEIIIFYWINKRGQREALKTTARFFKAYAIELLEEESLDKVTSVYYTIGNFITHKLDYYNAKL